MNKVTLTVNNIAFRVVEGRVRETKKLLLTGYRKNVEPLRIRILESIRKEPGKPDYPITWHNTRQRRKVMKLLRLAGMEDGYIRSHSLSKSWKSAVKSEGNGGVFQIESSSDTAIYVQGLRAQSFHHERWPQADVIARQYHDDALKVFIDTVDEIWD